MIFNISGFEILEKIGQGGMASVWKARQLSLDRIVAIKVLSEGFSGEPEDVRRFQEEAQSAAKLKHPGIVLVHDANAENGTYYFVMEYVSGYTVGDWVRRKGVLSEKDALLVADCVTDALGYAWDRANIVHCDIKPDNIIIDEDGTVKVADLGLASPEQAMGETNLDFRADIYSLGAMLYHLVTGKMMFDGFSDDETLDMQVNDRVDDPIDVNPSLSKGICWLIERMTAKDPALREDSWEAVHVDITRVRSGLLPKGKVLPDDASTVRRSVRRTVGDYKRVANIQKLTSSARTPVIKNTIKIAVLAVALAVALKMYIQQSEVDLVAEYTAPKVVTNIVHESEVDLSEEDSVVKDSRDVADCPPFESIDMENVRAKEMYDFAEAWQTEHSKEFTEAIEQFSSVVEETRGTKYSLMAQQKIRKLQSQKNDAIQAVIVALNSKVKSLVGDHEYKKAIALILRYDGSYAAETSKKRRELAKVLEKKGRSWDQVQRQKLGEDSLERQRRIDALVMAVLSDDLNLSMQLTSEMIDNRVFSSARDDMQSVFIVLKKASGMNEKIIESFASQYGETLDVYLVRGMRTLKIGSVSGDRVECRQMINVGYGGVSTIKIGIENLSDYERLQRMGDDSQYEVALVKGIMAFQSHAYSHAEKYFNMTHPFLKKYLLMKLSGESLVSERPLVAPARNEEVEAPSLDNTAHIKRSEPNIRRKNRPKHNRFDVFEEEEDLFWRGD